MPDPLSFEAIWDADPKAIAETIGSDIWNIRTPTIDPALMGADPLSEIRDVLSRNLEVQTKIAVLRAKTDQEAAERQDKSVGRLIRATWGIAVATMLVVVVTFVVAIIFK